MHWVPLIVWIAVVVVGALVLGYCAYEIVWKTKRLRADLAQLQADAAQLEPIRAALTDAQRRIAATSNR